MKEERTNEMDQLLRRLGRRPDVSVSEGNGDVEHLDADELNAYAENVLPAAARSRYTAHLAECSRCRDLVVQLSSSAGVVPVTVKAPEPSALRKFLASLFSPLVLRYAVPALGLIVVAAIGVFVLQKKQPVYEVAQNTEATASKPHAGVNTQEAESTPKPFLDQSTQPQPAVRPEHQSGSPENKVAAAAPAEPPPPAPAKGEVDSLAKKEQAQQPAVAETVTVVEPKSTTDARVEQAKNEPRDDAARTRSANGPPAEKEKSAAAVNVEDRKQREETPSQPATSTTPLSLGGLAKLKPGAAAAQAQKKRDEAADKDKTDAPTKTVAGRRFRKQDGVWVDTAYDSVRNPVNLTRGSEQYRALIADEPEIKKIADELDGEIIVVWKGHTYRIK